MGAHAAFAPSSAKKWIMCPGSHKAEARYPDSSSDAADEGTAAHTVLEWVLSNKAKAKDYPDKEVQVGGKGWTVTGEMRDAVDTVADHVRAYPGILMPEVKVDMGDFGLRDCWGTSDIVVIDLKGRVLYVDDLKFGRNVLVCATNNPQLMLYALGALATIQVLYGEDCIDEIAMTIHQPRRKGPDTWRIPVSRLRIFAEAAVEAQADALSPDPTFKAGAHCKDAFCAHRANCLAYKEMVFAAIDDTPKPDEAPRELLAKARALTDLARDWAKQVEDEVDRLLRGGEEVPGWKIVQGNSSGRVFTDEAKAKTRLKGLRLKIDDYMPRKMVTAPQAEKLVGKKAFYAKFDDIVEKKPGPLTVVPADDPRPSAIKSASEAFADLADMPDDAAALLA